MLRHAVWMDYYNVKPSECPVAFNNVFVGKECTLHLQTHPDVQHQSLEAVLDFHRVRRIPRARTMCISIPSTMEAPARRAATYDGTRQPTHQETRCPMFFGNEPLVEEPRSMQVIIHMILLRSALMIVFLAQEAQPYPTRQIVNLQASTHRRVRHPGKCWERGGSILLVMLPDRSNHPVTVAHVRILHNNASYARKRRNAHR
ncbi:uncharacterized protein B0H18DRAFT_664412 [Fomitopsis serialis]|uniref:uncharacterized protein n=1 Tax=Fomitopsis serialis TaxID=139415 RepID=UPI002007BB67|nr:uncharacterized protein B0H18DRAFT_664412 [Neoantrodia serialis]KAH9918586.1 hypothetical protein B0H18DRAFT_664412 [Neoantrodia serialis]